GGGSFTGILVPDQAPRHRAEQRQRVERGCVRIARILSVQTCHRVGIGTMTDRRITVAEQELDSPEVRFLFCRARLRVARRSGRSQSSKYLTRGFEILMTP